MIFLNRPDEPTTKKSTDCGPEENIATDIGEWKQNKDEAGSSAKTAAKAIAVKWCKESGAKCPSGKKCNYLEKSSSSSFKEERKNNNGNIEYRHIATSKGTCVCE